MGWFSTVGDLESLCQEVLIFDEMFYVLPINEAISWIKGWQAHSPTRTGDPVMDWWRGFFPIMATPFGDFVMMNVKTGKVVSVMRDYRYEKDDQASSLLYFIKKVCVQFAVAANG